MSLALPGFFRTLGFNVLQLSPVAAYSLRSLDPSLDPTVVNVRRSSDSATSDFTASEVSDGTLTSWVGVGNDGYVATWYDQSGNSEDATQASSGSQPKIVNVGALVTEGGKPALSFDGTNDRSMNSSLAASSTKSVFYVKKGASVDGNSVVLAFPATTNQVGIYYFASTPYEYGFNTWAGDSWGYTGGDTEFLSHTVEMALFKDGDPAVNGCKLHINGVEKTLSQVKGNSANRTMADGFRIGAGQTASNQDYDGTQQEIIIYSSDQSANRVTIEDNINEHFIVPNFFRIGSNLASLYVSPTHSSDLDSILAGTYDFTTVDAIDGTIVVATEEGTYSAEISLNAATTYDLYAQGVNTAQRGFMATPVGYAIFPSTLSDGEIAEVEAHFVAAGAAPKSDFGSVTNFFRAWRSCDTLTSFPLIDTSSATNLREAWQSCSSLTAFPLIDTSLVEDFRTAWRSCSSLTSFPLIDVSLGENFDSAWRLCTSLTSFPANFFDSWSPASLSSGLFNLTWDGSTSLTAQSVENILTSLDTSGIYGTDTGLSGGTQLVDHTIDIDYDGTTLSAATTTAITNLKTRDWAISINSVIQ